MIQTEQARSWRLACPASPATSACASPRCGRSTTRSRACSGSSSDDRAGARQHGPAGRDRASRAIVGYTLRSCFPPKRWAAILLPCAGALLFGLLTQAVDDPPTRAFANVAAEGIFGLIMPIAALVIGDSVLGAEVRAGTFHFTWMSPVPIWQIVTRALDRRLRSSP